MVAQGHLQIDSGRPRDIGYPSMLFSNSGRGVKLRRDILPGSGFFWGALRDCKVP